MLYMNRFNIYSICWCAVRPFWCIPINFDPPVPTHWLAHLSIGLWLGAWDEPVLARSPWMYPYWNYYYEQLNCTKLIIAYEYCWYYGVLGDRAIFLVGVVCWLFCRSRMICHVPVLFSLIGLIINSSNTTAVTDPQHAIYYLGRIQWFNVSTVNYV